MTLAEQNRAERRARARSGARADILASARRVAEREGARNLSLRGVAAEAGFAPAALYGYFRDKDELMLALAADDLASIAHAMRDAASRHLPKDRLGAAASVALELLATTETLAAASAAIAPKANGSEMERLFNGRLIAALTALSAAAGGAPQSREAQADIVLLAASLAGLAVMRRGGRLAALGFTAEEMLARLDARFATGQGEWTG
jgi:AcrR family transcriptional regulator